MTAKTHVLGGMTFALGGFIYLKQTSMLIPDVNEALQIGIILPYAIWTSTVPDLDQNRDSLAYSSPINLAIQKVFAVIGAGHRSPKSHVYPMLLSLVLYVATLFGFSFSNFNSAEITIIGLISLGIFLGLASHFLLDLMTRQGLKIGGVTLRLVPDLDAFGTGTYYETIVGRILYVITCVLFILIFIK